MKTGLKSAVVVLIAAAGAAWAGAATPEEAYIAGSRQDSSVPVPIAVVTPRIDPAYEGKSVEVTFVVDRTGAPTGVTIKDAAEPALAASIVEAVRQWRFRPALREGEPVPMKVSLPVRIVPGPAVGLAMK